MDEPPYFDHQKLDVYRLAIEFLSWAGAMLDGPLAGSRYAACKHLDDASPSIATNIAAGNGQRSLADRCRFLDIARGSALECAACLAALGARRRLVPDQITPGKRLLQRLVSRLTKMVEKFLRPRTRGRGGEAPREHEHAYEYEHEWP